MQGTGCTKQIVCFGVFELDLGTGELRKQGVRLRLQDQPFRILTALLEQPGEVVTREELVQRLWPDGLFVDFERGLNAAVTRLRQVLADSAESPRYIETVPRRGYRLLVPVRTFDADPAPLRPPRSRLRIGNWSIAGVAAAFVLVAVVVSRSLPFTGLPLEPKLEQITRDPGLVTDPAVSLDGKLLAYASDRGGQNLNIWVKQLAGEGQAVQLTHYASDAHQPSFSPDGSQVVYRSEQKGGGIYLIPAIGGEPRLIANGRNPRFSPDGKWIAYWDTMASSGVFAIAASGGEARRIGSDLPPAAYPVWAPDSKNLLVYAAPHSGLLANDSDWWITPLDGGGSRRTGAFAALASQGFSLSFTMDLPQAADWVDDAVVFSASKGDSRSIWQIRMDLDHGAVVGRAERLTLGTALDVAPSALGRRSVFFASLNRSMAIWSAPLDANRAMIKGELQRLTDGATLDATPSLTADGTLLAYGTTAPKHERIWLKDLTTGKETPVANTSTSEWHPLITRDGSMIAYTVMEPHVQASYIVPTSGGEARKVISESGWIFDWTPDKQHLLYHQKLAKHPEVKSVDLRSGAISTYVAKQGASLFQTKFSPDGHWLALEAVMPNSSGTADDSRLFIVKVEDGLPVRGPDWILVTEEHGWADKPRWSPDGNTLYFVSNRDGFTCVWAQRLDPATKSPAGAPLPVYHFHTSRLSPLNMGAGLLEMDVANDKMVINSGELTGNVWRLFRQ